MDDHLFHWLETKLDDEDESSADFSDVDLERELSRADRCAAALGRHWPAEDGSNSYSNQESLWSGNQCGRFEILELLGRGGMGNVFRAHDPTIGRDVALKIPHPGLLLDPAARERFSREAQAAGILRHPNIVPVLESGSFGPMNYIVFEYCEGLTLAQWLADQDRALPPKMAVQTCIGLAEAIQHAHDRGVVHRDLKPGNILIEGASSTISTTDSSITRLLGKQGKVAFTPRITDFGLARLTTGNSDLTRTGATLGTAEYMAPERASGEGDEADPASDQFSLGVILYQMLTNVSPFRRHNIVATIAAVQGDDPPPPSKLNPNVSRDLDAVCIKALSKAPADRYSTVGEFSDDLTHYLSGHPTVARPISRTELSTKWMQRHKALVASVGVCFLALTAMTLFGLLSAKQVRTALDQSNDMLYASDVRVASESLEKFSSANARNLLARHIPQPGETDRRTFPWYHLWESIHQEVAKLDPPPGHRAYVAVFSPDGKRIITGHDDGAIRIWNKQTEQVIRTLEGHSDAIHALKFIGNTLVSVDASGVVANWLLDVSTPIAKKENIPNFAYGAIAADNHDFAYVLQDGQLMIRRAGTEWGNAMGHSSGCTGCRVFARRTLAGISPARKTR